MQNYIRAYEKYNDVAIGNKTWSVGINMLGVHARTGKSRIFFTYILRNLKRSFK